MKVAIMGSGGIGGCIGGRLAANGADVLFLARGAHLQVLRDHGLRLTSPLGDLALSRVKALADARGEPHADFVIFAVKGPETIGAAEVIAPLVGPETAIITFQNGVESVEILQQRFGGHVVMPGVTYIGAIIESPGHIRQVGSVNRSLFGEVDGNPSARGRAFSEMAKASGLDMQLVDNILQELWSKFAMLGPFSSLACLSRLPVGAWANTPETLELFIEGMREVVALGRAKGVDLDAVDLTRRHTDFVQKLEPSWKGSMLTDLERGKPIEIASLAGYVHRAGKLLGVATPFHSTAFRALCFHAQAR